MKTKNLRDLSLLLTLALALSLLLGGCSSGGASAKTVDEKTLYNKGMELIDRMSTQAGALRTLFRRAEASDTEEISAAMKEVASLKPERAKVYSIKGYMSPLKDQMEEQFGFAAEKDDEGYDILLEKMQRTQASLLLSLNQYEAIYLGSSVAAVSNYQLMNISDVFPGKLEEPVAYLYHMGSSGSVLVSFMPAGAENSYVSATAVYLFSPTLKEIGSRGDIQDYIDKVFSNISDLYQYKVSKVDVD